MRLSQIAPIVPCPSPPSLLFRLTRRKIVRGGSAVYRRAVRPPSAFPRHSVTPARSGRARRLAGPERPRRSRFARLRPRPRASRNRGGREGGGGSPRRDACTPFTPRRRESRYGRSAARTRHTSPAKMAIFETRAINARMPHASIPRRICTHCRPPPPQPSPPPPFPRATLRGEKSREIFFRPEHGAAQAVFAREGGREEREARSKADCFLTIVCPFREPPARMDTWTREEKRGRRRAVGTFEIFSFWKRRHVTRANWPSRRPSLPLDTSRPLRYEDSDYCRRDQWGRETFGFSRLNWSSRFN